MWASDIAWVDTLLLIGAAAGAFTAIVVAASRLWSLTVGVFKRIRAMHELMEAELTPNGGGSIKDTVHRIDRDLTQHVKDYIDLRERVDELEDDGC